MGNMFKVNMKKVIKRVYMFIFHPYLFFEFYKKTLFVGRYSDIRHANQILVGENVNFGYGTRINFFSFGKHNDKRLFIGTGSYICNRCSFIIGGEVNIGENVLIASDVTVVSHNHGFNPELKIPYGKQPITCETIKIENNVWIGEKVIILPGITIGEGSVIGAGSVVTHNIPQYSIAVGNPARIIKSYNFETKKWEK